ncbi:MAG TPA: protein arginine kinase [Planctomycetota bacterium]|nr:protein arginine kinase [Planctomycetota bacterium]
MEINDLSKHAGEWLRGEGPESDIIISSRIRLARNLADFPFTNRASAEQRAEIAELLRDRVAKIQVRSNALNYFDLVQVNKLDLQFLVERHLISKELAQAEGARGVAINGEETVSIMINEEDHLRLQVLKSGFQLGETWEIIDELDDAIDRDVNYAFSLELGYLTACPTNVGTGMRASVMLHLPALLFTRQIDKVITAVGKMNLVVRGLYGEGTQYAGSLYQVSNQVTLGKSEEEILDNIVSTVPQIVRYERRARETLLSQNRAKLEDRIYRSLGMLKSARTISSNETITLLSHLRLGINLGLIEMDIGEVNQLFIRALPAHLQKLEGKELEPDERDSVRAAFIRRKLGEL